MGSASDGRNVGEMIASDEGYAVVVFILSSAAAFTALFFLVRLPWVAASVLGLVVGIVAGILEYRRMKRPVGEP